MPDSSVRVMRCPSCGTLDPGPRELCGRCFTKLEPFTVSGDGEIVSWTVIRRPPLAFKDEKSYAVAVVRLDAGCQVTGRLHDPEPSLLPGTRVRAIGSHRSVPVFAASQKG